MTLDESYYVPSKLADKANFYQKVAGMCAILCAIIAVIMTANYMNNSDESENYLGGLNWGELIFNWHPLLMVTGLIFCAITSLLSYRVIPLNKLATKAIHFIMHTAAIICVVVGLCAVLMGNNYTNKNEGHVYYSNFNSLHSFIGLGAIILYAQNYILGFAHYIAPMALSFRKAYMPSHIFLGTFSFFAAVMACLTGLMKLAVEANCGYEVTSADTNPAAHYHLLTGGCKLNNGIGVMILLTAFFAAYALWENHKPAASTPSESKALLEDAQRA